MRIYKTGTAAEILAKNIKLCVSDDPSLNNLDRSRTHLNFDISFDVDTEA